MPVVADVRVLRNLVSNAIRYGTSDEPIRTDIISSATEVRFEVSNKGPTIEHSALEQIFDPFKRCVASGLGKPNNVGLWLGLFIVREVARGHEGEVGVHSAEGVIIFDVLLPCRNENSASAGAPQDAAEGAATTSTEASNERSLATKG